MCYNPVMINLSKYENMKICVAVSGGRDSMALLYYIHKHAGEHGITLSALNCDHKIRGESSARDSKFVKEWCAERKIPLMFFEWNSNAPKTEANARAWRRKCYLTAMTDNPSSNDFKQSVVYTYNGCEWKSADAVATAHHLDDNAETILFNLARGCALSGMAGISDYSIADGDGATLKIIHPLVNVSREEIDMYVKANQIPFVEDETNSKDDYTRNKIRHNVLPELEKAVPGAAKAIYRFSRLAADDEQYFDNLIGERKLLKNTRLGFEIRHCEEKVVFKRAVVKVLTAANIKDYTSEHAQKLYELQFAEKGKKFEFLNFTAFREEGKIAICDTQLLKTQSDGVNFFEHFRNEAAFWNDILIYISSGEELDSELQALSAAAEDDDRISGKLKALKFDLGAIPETAVIRSVQDGDKFTKFGGGTKKLGDYFTDKKIPVRYRRHIPLIADGNEILAVGGVEISDKIKITQSTEKILYLICADFTAITGEF